MMPQDPIMLLGYVNMQLRDFYASLDALCDDQGVRKRELQEKLAAIDYRYDEKINKFI